MGKLCKTMAMNFIMGSSLLSNPSPCSSPSSSSSSVLIQKKHSKLQFSRSSSSSFKTFVQSEDAQKIFKEVDEESPSSSARTQLELLQQLTSTSQPIDDYDSDGRLQRLTIRDQLAQLVGKRDGDFTIPLGKKNLKKVSKKFLSISQKRNIKRQAYLNEVSQRNDSVFFATIGAFVLLPPLVILGIAIGTGYVQLFP